MIHPVFAFFSCKHLDILPLRSVCQVYSAVNALYSRDDPVSYSDVFGHCIVSISHGLNQQAVFHHAAGPSLGEIMSRAPRTSGAPQPGGGKEGEGKQKSV